VTNVDDGSWTTVTLNNSYDDMVVVCSATYSNNGRPLVVRVRNVTGSSFQIRIQNPGDGWNLDVETVHYIVMEAGAWTMPDGRLIEAQKYSSTVTDENNSWSGQSQTYLQSYTNPVVVGQVMSYNDSDWSAFWARGSSRSNPPSASDLWAGKHVGEDGDTTRSDETVGFIVIEQGHGQVSGVEYEAWLGGDSVRGVVQGDYSYSFDQAFSSTPQVAVVSMAGMDGGHGAWPMLKGANPLSASQITLGVDEDQIGDNERNHTHEQVAYFVFESGVTISPGPTPTPTQTPTLTPTTGPAGCGNGVNINIVSPASYQVAGLVVGDTYYIDRTYVLSSIPPAYAGLCWIETANNDKHSTGDAFLTFGVDQDVTVYVAYDSRGTFGNPGGGWTDTGDSVGTTDVTLNLWSQTFSAGTISLPGNDTMGSGASSMYVVLIQGLGLPTPTPTATPLPPDLIITDFTMEPLGPNIEGGQLVTFTVDIRNQGESDVNSLFWVAIHVDPTPTPPAGGGSPVLWQGVSSIVAGGNGQVTFTGYQFSSAGDHSVYAYVDNWDDIVEGDETNNASSPITVWVEEAPTPTPTATTPPNPGSIDGTTWIFIGGSLVRQGFVDVFLYEGVALLASTTSDAQGYYLFTVVEACTGCYTVIGQTTVDSTFYSDTATNVTVNGGQNTRVTLLLLPQ